MNLNLSSPSEPPRLPDKENASSSLKRPVELSLQGLSLRSVYSPQAQSVREDREGVFKDPRPLTTRSSGASFFNELQPKCSVRGNGIVRAYAACTSHGLVRNYNEDRVSIILNIVKPSHRASENWPHCSFFGVYDGHGGSKCADFLRDNLHQYVIRNQYFPFQPKEAIRCGFAAAEKAFLTQAARTSPIEKSGSCAIVLLIIGDVCYAANVGDSRAVMSGCKGGKIYPLSKDHKPSEEKEQQRILSNGGKIYQSVVNLSTDQKVLGPHRVFPGRLSVCRTFGDIEGKDTQLGGNPHVVIAQPDIKAFKMSSQYDFIVLASDGVFDKLCNREVVNAVWQSAHENKNPDLHKASARAVAHVLSAALERKTLDNITVVLVAFQNFATHLGEE